MKFPNNIHLLTSRVLRDSISQSPRQGRIRISISRHTNIPSIIILRLASDINRDLGIIIIPSDIQFIISVKAKLSDVFVAWEEERKSDVGGGVVGETSSGRDLKVAADEKPGEETLFASLVGGVLVVGGGVEVECVGVCNLLFVEFGT